MILNMRMMFYVEKFHVWNYLHVRPIHQLPIHRFTATPVLLVRYIKLLFLLNHNGSIYFGLKLYSMQEIIWLEKFGLF